MARTVFLLMVMWPLIGQATGISVPHLRVVDENCEAVDAVDPKSLRLVVAEMQMTCARPHCSDPEYLPRSPDTIQIRVVGCPASIPGKWEVLALKCSGVPVVRFTGTLPAGQRVQVFAPGGQPTLQVRGRGSYSCPESVALGKPLVQVSERRDMKFWVPANQVTESAGHLIIPARLLGQMFGGEPARVPLGGLVLGDVVGKIRRHPTTGYLELLGDEKRTLTWQSLKAGARAFCQLDTQRVNTLRLPGTGLSAIGHVKQNQESEGRCSVR